MHELQENAHRIFDPYSYKATLQERFIPVSLHECFDLAALYPLVWRPNHIGALELVAVRSLRIGKDITRLSQARLHRLPLLLQGYPFRFRSIETEDFEIGMERVAPAHERDQGTYIFNHEKELEAGADLKISALEDFQHNYDDLHWITDLLRRSDAFEPVKLPDAANLSYKIPNMWAARDDLDLEVILQDCPVEKSARILRFLVSQRVSLYRMGAVLAASEGDT